MPHGFTLFIRWQDLFPNAPRKYLWCLFVNWLIDWLIDWLPDRPVTYLYNTLHYYERCLHEKAGLKKKLVGVIIGKISLFFLKWKLNEMRCSPETNIYFCLVCGRFTERHSPGWLVRIRVFVVLLFVVGLRGSISINALRACVNVGGHFRMIRKWRTSSIFVFCLVKKIGINSEKCIEYSK